MFIGLIALAQISLSIEAVVDELMWASPGFTNATGHAKHVELHVMHI